MKKILMKSLLFTFSFICFCFLTSGDAAIKNLNSRFGKSVPGEPGAVKKIHVPYVKMKKAQVTSAMNVNISQIEVSEFPKIKVYAQVKNENQEEIGGLDVTNFTLTEQSTEEQTSVKEQITNVEEMAGNSQLNIALVIDTSGSMDYTYGNTTGIDAAKLAAKAFIDSMGSTDKACVVSFSDDAELQQPLTSDKNTLNTAIDGLSADGSTSMYDGVYLGLEQLSSVTGIKACQEFGCTDLLYRIGI